MSDVYRFIQQNGQCPLAILAPVANGHWPFCCIKRYTSDTRGVKAFHGYTAHIQDTAIHHYTAIHRYTLYNLYITPLTLRTHALVVRRPNGDARSDVPRRRLHRPSDQPCHSRPSQNAETKGPRFSLLPSLRRPSKGPKGPASLRVSRRDPSRRHVARPPRARERRQRARAALPTRVWRDAAAILKPPATLARETRKLCTPSHFMSLRESWGKRMIITDL